MNGFTDLHPTGTTYEPVGDANVPWVYADAEAEYDALRQRAALFDLSACGLLRITGNSTAFLQRVLARDVEFLTPDRCLTSLLLGEDGSPVDIVSVYLLDDGAILETSIGTASSTLAFLRAHAGDDVEITELGDWATIAIEGPYAWGVVGRVIDPAVTALPYESVTTIAAGGGEVVFVRAGVTAEYGYKILGQVETLRTLWASLSLEATPAGYAALELAMLEVRQPLLHAENLSSRSVFASGVSWLLDPTKGSYLGSDAVLRQFESLDDQPATVGFLSQVPLAPGTELFADGDRVGSVVVSRHSPGVGGHVGLVEVSRDYAAAGLVLQYAPDDDASTVTTLASPYLCPTSWSTPIL